MDRELALWVELVWCRLRTRPSPRLGYASSISSRLDREIWDVLQAELTPAADTITLTQTSCTFHFISQESISRIFFPARFAQIACRGGSTPFLRTYSGGEQSGVSFTRRRPFIISYSFTKRKVNMKFEFIYVNAAGVEFFNDFGDDSDDDMST